MSFSRRLLRIARQTLADLADGIYEPSGHTDARQELESYLAGPRFQPKPPPAPPPAHPLKQYYETLGAPVGADLATVEKIWRRQVLASHPDRFMHDPAEQRRASDRLRRLNSAHDVLVRELSRQDAK